MYEIHLGWNWYGFNYMKFASFIEKLLNFMWGVKRCNTFKMTLQITSLLFGGAYLSCGRNVMWGAILGPSSREWRAINYNSLYHIYFEVPILLKQKPHPQTRVLIDQRSAFSTSERQILCYNYGPTSWRFMIYMYLEIITCPPSRYQAYRPGSSIFAQEP